MIKKIGITSNGYPNQRNINNLTSNRYIRINIFNIGSYVNFGLRTLYKLFRIDLQNAFLFVDYKGFFFDGFFYDVAHFFNAISVSKQKWMTTFETTAPFYRKEIEEYLYADMNINSVVNRRKLELGIRACASDSCVVLIALSNCSMDIQLNLISNYPDYESKIRSKLIQLYPPQKLLVNSFNEKQISVNDKLRFMFVGREFYRKAGLEILRCFEKLVPDYDFELILVSGLSNDVPDIIHKEDENEAESIIDKYNGTWLTYYSGLENDEVINLMKEVHIGLLPTYSETFGYAVLEFQACGCPVITTDVRALHEINNDSVGWIIPVGEKSQYGEIKNLGQFIKNRTIENELKRIITGIFDERNIIESKSNASINRIAEFHSPEKYSTLLSEIYQRK